MQPIKTKKNGAAETPILILITSENCSSHRNCSQSHRCYPRMPAGQETSDWMRDI